MKNKKKISILLFFSLSTSILLILFSLLSSVSSVKAVHNLASYAYKIDKQNNDSISSNLLYSITYAGAELYSKILELTNKSSQLLASAVLEQLVESKNFNLKDNSLKFDKYNDFFLDNSKSSSNIFYWGNKRNVPSDIIKSLNSLKEIEYLFSSLKDTGNNYYNEVWVVSPKKFAFEYPADNKYYMNKNKKQLNKYYNSFFDFPDKLEDKSIEILPSIFDRPYVDFSEKLVMGARTAIYHNGILLATVGIDFNFKHLQESMLSNPLSRNFSKQNLSDISFLFLLSNHGHIITFPKEYAKLFHLPEKYLNLKSYIDYNTTKLSDSTDNKIKKLNDYILKNKSGTMEISLDNKSFDIAFARVDSTDWTLAYVVEKQYLLSPTLQSKKLIKSVELQLLKKYSYLTVTFILLSFLFLYVLFKYFLLSPIKNIQKNIQNIKSGNLNIKLKEKGTSEIAGLASGLNFLSKKIIDYIEILKVETANRQNIETEIQIAEKIQQSILPNPDDFPTNDLFLINAKLNPAKNVSGDFFDFFYLDENKIALLIADVSGKGLQAAFFMATSKALIKDQCHFEKENPGKVLEHVNKQLCKDNKAQMFVTVNLSFYNINDGSYIASNAGHHQAIILKNNSIVRLQHKKNIALGILDEMTFNTVKGRLNINDTAFQYTDGIPEAISPSGEEYGEKRLEILIQENCKHSINVICKKIIKDVKDFEHEDRFDDITLLALKRLR